MKRYVRTADGKIHDLENPKEEIGHLFIVDSENEKRNFIVTLFDSRFIKDSNNIFDLIMFGDLVFFDDDVYCIFRKDCCRWSLGINIAKIYTKQGDNYILVWDKNKGVI